MQVIFESRTAEASTLREVAIKRVRFALRRLSVLVPRAKVLLSDENGPKGGIDKRCQVELTTDNSEKLVIYSLASDWRTALDLSLGRATRALTRNIKRAQRPVRGRAARLEAELC